MTTTNDGFTVKEIVVEVRDALKDLIRKFDDLREDTSTINTVLGVTGAQVQDHEKRLRRLETWRWRSTGIAAALAFALTTIATASWHIWG